MIKLIIIVVVLVLGMSLSGCGGGRYPFGTGKSNDVYYGPEYYEVKNDDEKKDYPDDPGPSADVYGGPEYRDNDDDTDEKYPNTSATAAPVYAGPEQYDDDDDNTVTASPAQPSPKPSPDTPKPSPATPTPTTAPTDDSAIPAGGGSVRISESATLTFSPAKSGIWVLYTSDRGGSSPMLGLYDSQGGLVNEDMNGAADLNAMIVQPMRAGEKYSVIIDFYRGNGSCTLNAVAPAEIPAGGGSVRITSASGYSFTPDSSGTYELRISNNGSSARYYAIFDSDYALKVDDDDSGDRYDSVHLYSMNAGDTYHIAFRFIDSETGDCTLTVTAKS